MSSIKLVELAQQLDARLHGEGDIIITGIASIGNAQSGHITFLADYRLRNKLSSCKASAVVLTEDNLVFCNSAALIVKNPYLTYVKLVKLINKNNKLVQGIIGKGVVIASDVCLGERVIIGANTVIESEVILGSDVIIGPGSFIGKNTKIGPGTHLLANVTIHHETEIGGCCLIQSGAIIGSDGFGYIKGNDAWVKIPQLGKVIIGNKVEIGSCTTIDRGTLDDTYIGNGVIIDNQCQIAHNVIIGDHTAIAGGVIMAGSLTIGRYCMIGGATVINGHIDICDQVTITGMSMVMRSIIEPGVYSSGIPAQPNTIWRKTAVMVMNIINMSKRMKIIERKLAKLE